MGKGWKKVGGRENERGGMREVGGHMYRGRVMSAGKVGCLGSR